MCLLLLALDCHPKYKLVLAANRDENYERPTAQAGYWHGEAELLAGRDLRSGGTWLGITKDGRVSAITNYQGSVPEKSEAPSRGLLVKNFLVSQMHPIQYVRLLEKGAKEYNGFNLIIGQGDEFYWYSNSGNDLLNLRSGIYGLSNHLLDSPWPKVTRGKNAIGLILRENKDLDLEMLFELLRDRSLPADESVSNTAISQERESMLSPIFVTSPSYGTRSSTIVLIDRNDYVTFIEKTFYPRSDNVSTVEYEFRVKSQSIKINDFPHSQLFPKIILVQKRF